MGSSSTERPGQDTSKGVNKKFLIAYTLANIKGRLFSIKNNGDFYRILETLKKREFYLGTPKYAMNC